MPIQKQSYQIQGMRQDNLVATGYSNKSAHEIMNMRLNTIGDYTTASWTTEKGTKSINVLPMFFEGDGSTHYKWITNKTWVNTLHGTSGHYSVNDFKPLGQACINDQWVLFGTVINRGSTNLFDPTEYSVILLLKYVQDNTEENLYGRILYWGDLGFDNNHPIETLPFYENDQIQKVYWTDGKNQPRVINIKGAGDKINGFDANLKTQFDFVQEVALNETVTINKDQSGTGLFPPCTVKYAITYYHKYGQETNIVYDSPLYYPTKGDRGCSPDELSGDSFVIKVENIDAYHGFDYIRLYSIVRTSDNATPIVRIVADKEISSLPRDTDNNQYALFIDTNTTGEIVDPTILNYIGGWNVSIGTFTSKDNVLFAGDIKLHTKSLKNFVEEEGIEYTLKTTAVNFEQTQPLKKVLVEKTTINPDPISGQNQRAYTTSFPYFNQLNYGNSFTIKSFKKGEYYRFGLQFQDKFGRWSDVLQLTNDSMATLAPEYIDDTDTHERYYKLSYATYTISAADRQTLLDNDYKKARLVCCYTNNADRTSILQGVVNPTVYNKSENDENVIDAMSSWFFRPIGGDPAAYNADNNTLQINRIIPWSNDHSFPNSGKSNAEIQSLSARGGHSSNYPADVDGYANILNSDNPPQNPTDYYDPNNTGAYKVRNSILTLNSPELDFDESLRTLPLDSCSIDIIGAIPINSYVSKYYIDAESVGVALNDSKKGQAGIGFVNKSRVYKNTSSLYGTHDIAAGYWDDIDVYENNAWRCAYPLYPFQRQGSLNNYMGDYDETTESAKLNSKVFATLMFSNKTEYINIENLASSDNDFQIYDYNENVPIRLGSETYYGNMNSIVPLSDEEDFYIHKNDESNKIYGHYKIYEYYPEDKYDLYGKNNYANYDHIIETDGGYTVYTVYKNSRLWSNVSADGEGGISSNPIPLTYKSTIHGVFSTIKNISSLQTNIDIPYLYLVEMTRGGIDADTRFGGKNNKANIYTPCGPAENLNGEGPLKLYGLEGDHYFMRYDCLKTYSYTPEDINQIVEILSFMVESRVNLDGRYDKNRGLTDNTMVTNTNFNLINKSYTQQNNAFTFTTLDELGSKLNTFPNQITWTKEKVSGEDIDAWTNITLASTADADGTLGKITNLTSFNDRIILFQEHGISQVNYNENTAISTEANIPLELAKTGKFTGFNYLSKEVGCQNKWSISQSKNGLFWIDDSRQELMTFGENMMSLSTANGFDAFMIRELPKTFVAWNPNTFENFVTYYDKLSNDVYYINNSYCIAWNEQSKTFTSFYNYEGVPYMINIGQHSLIWKNGVWAAREADGYSTFFGNTKDYWITLVCDGMTDKGSAFPADKVFNNIEYRADIYNLDGTHTNYSNSIFNKKHVWNGYQDSEECSLEGIRKFNTWRVQLPRHHGTRDRIRNPFCYIKLKQDQLDTQQTDRIILHDLAVYFDIR